MAEMGAVGIDLAESAVYIIYCVQTVYDIWLLDEMKRLVDKLSEKRVVDLHILTSSGEEIDCQEHTSKCSFSSSSSSSDTKAETGGNIDIGFDSKHTCKSCIEKLVFSELKGLEPALEPAACNSILNQNFQNQSDNQVSAQNGVAASGRASIRHMKRRFNETDLSRVLQLATTASKTTTYDTSPERSLADGIAALGNKPFADYAYDQPHLAAVDGSNVTREFTHIPGGNDFQKPSKFIVCGPNGFNQSIETFLTNNSADPGSILLLQS
ncbi:hypothetical protein AYI70_g9318 [Smittium culicis]|uniref:Uncharacterized protein n=1 Tax=Smittium culicis TaxID=133412 RepID=A0A1R1XBT3_9FUNG|nr:hypothetical protein AYI70_g9318 [Smittium culicis]